MKKSLLLCLCIIFTYTISNAQIAVYVVDPQSLTGSLNFTWGEPGTWGTSDLNIPANSVQDTIMMVDDGTSADSLGCNSLINDLTGKIAILYRGTCEFGTKSLNAQNAGAVGVIIINHTGEPVGMNGGTDGPNVTIPVVMISEDNGAILRAGLDQGLDIIVFIGNKTGYFNHDLGMAGKDVLIPRATGNPLITSLDSSEWNIPMGAWIFNYGIDAQTNVVLTADFTGTTNVSMSSTPISSLAPGDSVWADLGTYSSSFYNGMYNIEYTISADSVDGFPGDNTFIAGTLIDSLISYARIDTATWMPVSSAHYSLTTPPATYESCIHFMDPNASRLAALGIYNSASGGANGTLVGETIEARIYEWNDVFTGFSDGNFPASPWTLNTIDNAYYSYTADLQREMVYIPFSDSIQLVDNQRYLFCAITYNASEIWMGFDSYYDYNQVLDTTDQPVSIVMADAEQYAAGFGTDVTSSVTVKVALSNTSASLFTAAITATSGEFCDPACDGFATVTALLGQTPYTYLWDDPNAQTTATAAGLCNGTYSVIVTDADGESDTAMVTFAEPSSAPVFTLSATSTEFCNGDSVWVTASAVPQGVYTWSTGDTTETIAIDSVGTYSVTVTNCGGTTTEYITFTVPSAPPVFTVSASETIMCVGDSVTLSASNVSQGLYVWSTGDTAQSIVVTDTGTYTVNVTNCGGTSNGSITLVLPDLPIATITGNVEYCSGDSIVLFAGNEPSATYLWSTGETTQSLTVSTQGSFTVTVTNCAGSDQATEGVSFYPSPSVIMDVNGQTTFCDDGGTTSLQLTAFASGGTPFTYVWSNASTSMSIILDSVSETGDYYVTAYDICGASVMSDTAVVLIHESPTASTVSVTNASAIGMSDGAIDAAVSGGTPPYIYFWNDPNSQASEDATNLLIGTYQLVVTDANNCTGSLTETVGNATSIELDLNVGRLNALPNPSNGKFIVELRDLNNDEYSFEIRNILGQLVYVETLKGNAVQDLSIDLTESEKGVYLLTISNSKGKRTEKLVIY